MKTRKSIVTPLIVAICAMTMTMFVWGNVLAAEVISAVEDCEMNPFEDAADESVPVTVVGNDLMVGGCEVGEEQVFLQGPAVSKSTVTYVDRVNNKLKHAHLRDVQAVEELDSLRLSREGKPFEYWFVSSDPDMTPYVYGHTIAGELTLMAYCSPTPDEEEGLSPLEAKETNDCACSIIESIVSLGKCKTDGLEATEGSDCAKAIVESIVCLGECETDDLEATESNGCVPAILEDTDCLWTCESDDTRELDGEGADPADENEAKCPNRSVKIHSSAGALVYEHDVVTLRGELSGLDGCAYTLQWQVQNDGQWKNIKGANDIAYCYFATAESIYCKYRLCVAILG